MKSLNVEEKTILRQQGFNPRKFLKLGMNWESFTFAETKTGKKLTIRR